MIGAVIIMLSIGVIVVAMVCLAVVRYEPSPDNWWDEQDRRRASLDSQRQMEEVSPNAETQKQ